MTTDLLLLRPGALPFSSPRPLCRRRRAVHWLQHPAAAGPANSMRQQPFKICVYPQLQRRFALLPYHRQGCLSVAARHVALLHSRVQQALMQQSAWRVCVWPCTQSAPCQPAWLGRRRWRSAAARRRSGTTAPCAAAASAPLGPVPETRGMSNNLFHTTCPADETNANQMPFCVDVENLPEDNVLNVNAFHPHQQERRSSRIVGSSFDMCSPAQRRA